MIKTAQDAYIAGRQAALDRYALLAENTTDRIKK